MAGHALIVGAGIGGLAAAVALHRAGWTVRVFERASSPRELGFALSLAPNAVAALRELGAADAALRDGFAVRRVEIRADRGRILRRIDATGVVTDSVVALRPAVHGALLEALPGGALGLASEATHFEHDARHVWLQFRDGRQEEGDVLIGADGTGSIIRRLLHPAEGPPRPSGYHAVRGVFTNVAAVLGDLEGVMYLAPRLESAIVRAARDAAYWYQSWLTEDVRNSGVSGRALAERAASRLDQTAVRAVAATVDDDLRVDELYERRPLSEWGRGRATLLGDAAHPMLPHTGQGAAQAIEDAVALGLALGRDGDIDAALRRYAAVRGARTARFVRLGPRIAKVTTSRSALLWRSRYPDPCHAASAFGRRAATAEGSRSARFPEMSL